jgi:hypothetical protein
MRSSIYGFALSGAATVLFGQALNSPSAFFLPGQVSSVFLTPFFTLEDFSAQRALKNRTRRGRILSR